MLAQSFSAHWVILFIPLICLAINAVWLSGLPHPHLIPILAVFLGTMVDMVPIGIALAVTVRALQYLLVIKPKSPIRALIADAVNVLTKPASFINGFPVLMAIVVYNKAFLDLKPQIPFLNPFKWDQTFAWLDRTLHFGIDPWRILQPVMGFSYVTFASCVLYNLWFFVLLGSLFWFAFQEKSTELRTRFFLSYMLIWWLGGELLADYFSSAGPAYYSRLGLTPDPYAELMTYLHGANSQFTIWSLGTQDMLWNGYLENSGYMGISAFPSMHNASAVLFALAFRHINKYLGWFFMAYAAVILVTSVHLAWHYAVDGYAAIIISCTCWWLCGFVARAIHRQPTMHRHTQNLAVLAS